MELKGKKTYIMAGALLIYAIGGAVSGKLDLATAIRVGVEALALIGLRNALP